MNKTIIWTLVIFLFIVFVGIFTTQMQQKTVGRAPIYSKLPDFEFQDSEGQSFKRVQLYGKISVFNFHLTHLEKDTLTQAVKNALRPLINSNPSIQLLDVFPTQQNSEQANPTNTSGGGFLYAKKSALKSFMVKGMLMPKERLEAFANQKVVLIDAKARIRGYYSKVKPGDVAKLKADILTILNER